MNNRKNAVRKKEIKKQRKKDRKNQRKKGITTQRKKRKKEG